MSLDRSFFIALEIVLLLLMLLLTLGVLQQQQQIHEQAQVASTSPQPVGVPGNWTLVFDDEFDGTSIDTSKWTITDGVSMNYTMNYASNVSELGGNAVLTLVNPHSGGQITTNGANQYKLLVGDYVEGRVYFPGNVNIIYNWPAIWATAPGQNSFANGEHDIAEASSALTCTYHSGSIQASGTTPPGTWSNAFHTYGVYRQATKSDFYWDGKLVYSAPTSDNGQGEALVITIGTWSSSNANFPQVTGPPSQIKVDYVRAWRSCTTNCPTSIPSASTGP